MRYRSLQSQRSKRAGRDAYQSWRDSRWRCQLCHRPFDGRTEEGYWEAHRIIKGKAYDPRNVLFLCGVFQQERCHDFFESHTIRRTDGTPWPHLELSHGLWCKQDDPFDKYDPAFLQSLLGKRVLPEPEQLPEIFYDLRAYWSL